MNDVHVFAISKCTGRCHSALLRQKKRKERKLKEKEKFSSLRTFQKSVVERFSVNGHQ